MVSARSPSATSTPASRRSPNREVAKLWRDHAVKNRFLYKFEKGWSTDRCFAELAAKEPLLMQHCRVARLNQWNDLAKAARVGKVRDAAATAGDLPSAALTDPMLITTQPRVLGDDQARNAVTDSTAAEQQIASIIAEHRLVAPWKSDAELFAYAEGMRRAVERAQARVDVVEGRVGRPRPAMV